MSATDARPALVLIDVRSEDPVWFAWSSAALAEAADRGELAINPIIYAELSVDADRIEELDAELRNDYLRLPLPYEAGYLAGRALLDEQVGASGEHSRLELGNGVRVPPLHQEVREDRRRTEHLRGKLPELPCTPDRRVEALRVRAAVEAT